MLGLALGNVLSMEAKHILDNEEEMWLTSAHIDICSTQNRPFFLELYVQVQIKNLSAHQGALSNNIITHNPLCTIAVIYTVASDLHLMYVEMNIFNRELPLATLQVSSTLHPSE